MTFHSLVQILEENACRQPQETAFYYFDEDQRNWQSLSWQAYFNQVQQVASWLHHQGVQAGDRVVIYSANRPEWIIADMAIQWLGAVSVPIYATSAVRDVRYICQHATPKIAFVDTDKRAAAVKDAAPINVVTFATNDENGEVFKFKNLLTSSHGQVRQYQADAQGLATIIYTSGTTGLPKGVMHTHGNLRHVHDVLKIVLSEGKEEGFRDNIFSFLPLSHVAERALVQIGSLALGAQISFARSVATLPEDLVTCRPTILLCVPRLWEKMHEKIMDGVSRASRLKRILFAFATWLGSFRIFGNKVFRRRNHHPFVLLSDLLVGRALRQRLGLDQIRVLATGSAPTRLDVMRFFASFGLFIREVYGLTENFCLGVFNDPDITFNRCGKVFPGNQLRIAADGEIQFKAPWLFTGYYNDPVATAQVLSDGGWFSTGDLGEIDRAQMLRITGRKKELIKTSTGKYVSPVAIEDRLKANPQIQDAMLVGDNQKFCVALVYLAEGTCHEKFTLSLSSFLDQVNEDLAGHEAVKRLGVVTQPFTVENGLLTPSLKLKRGVAVERYKGFIEEVYAARTQLIFERGS